MHSHYDDSSKNDLVSSRNIKLRQYRYVLPAACAVHAISSRGGTIPEITMRYVSRYLSHDTIRITILF